MQLNGFVTCDFQYLHIILGLVKTFLWIKIGEEKGIREQGERREERGRKNRSRRKDGKEKGREEGRGEKEEMYISLKFPFIFLIALTG